MSATTLGYTAMEHRDPSSDEVRAQLHKILSSTTFGRAERLRQFLAFVVNESLSGRSAGIKEVLVAVEVFRRKPSFDPQTDSVVRVEAHNLRHRLATYYLREGAGDGVQIELPRGSYSPLFRRRVTTQAN